MKIIIVTIEASAGEVYVLVPILWKLKQVSPNVKIYFTTTQPNVIEKLKISQRYVEIMSDLGEFVFEKRKLLSLLFKAYLRRKTCLLMSCFSGSRNTDRLFYGMIKKSLRVYFPHTYHVSPFVNNQFYDDAYISYRNDVVADFEIRYGKNRSLLINSQTEVQYFEYYGWSIKEIYVIGAVGYTKSWYRYFGLEKQLKLHSDKIKVFVPLRDIHPDYLTEENYSYLLNSLEKVCGEFQSFEFIIKLHPRQEERSVKKQFATLNNVIFSEKSPFELCCEADITIGFWTSVAHDSVSIGTPAVEFHRHEVKHPHVVEREGRLKSLIVEYGLAEEITSYEELRSFLSSLDRSRIEGLQARQYENLTNYFDLNEEQQEQRIIKAFTYFFDVAQNPTSEMLVEKREMKKRLLVRGTKMAYRKLLQMLSFS